MSDKPRPRTVARIVFGSLGVGLVLWLASFVYREVRYAAVSTVTTGVVLPLEQEPVGPTVSARPLENRVRYSFVDHHGVAHINEVSLSERAPRYRVGDAIRVRYLKESPETNREVSATRIADSEGGILLLVLALGGLMVGVALWWTRADSFQAFTSWMKRHSFGGRRRRRRREQLSKGETPAFWLDTLSRYVRVFPAMSPAERERLLGLVKVFLAERTFEPCGGLKLTEEMRVVIAAHACRLLLGLKHDYFSHVPAILVYPAAFMIPAEEHAQGPTRDVAALGQAWYRGPVLLAWDEVEQDCLDPDSGKNVVLHEFAHQLDFLGDEGNLSPGRAQRQRWHEVMTQEYENLVRATEDGRSTLLDQYGSTNPAEFFAVATEAFFEKSARLRERHPRLYEVLRDYYGQEPA